MGLGRVKKTSIGVWGSERVFNVMEGNTGMCRKSRCPGKRSSTWTQDQGQGGENKALHDFCPNHFWICLVYVLLYWVWSRIVIGLSLKLPFWLSWQRVGGRWPHAPNDRQRSKLLRGHQCCRNQRTILTMVRKGDYHMLFIFFKLNYFILGLHFFFHFW